MTVIQNMKKVNKRIPGLLPPPPKSEIDGKISNLSSKSIPELLELRDRQIKLLNNKSFVSKLPDKGQKIQLFYERISCTLKEKEEEEHTCRLLSNMNINLDNQSVQNVEWEGKLESKNSEYLDSDDDSEPEDVLHILSQSTTAERKVKVLPPEKLSVTAADLQSIEETPHVKFIVEKTETNAKPKPTGQFKPFKTTKSDVHNPEKEIHRKKHKNWEVTAATPPPTVHGPAKLLSLEESLILQKDYNIHLKEISAQHATEKLMARTGLKIGELPLDTSTYGHYREVKSDDSEQSDMEGSDKEVHDEEPERGGVVFTIMK